MKVFVWRCLDQVSENYHPEGGLLVVAESLAEAINKAEENRYIKADSDPDFVYDILGAVEPVVVVFPDAGCC